MRSRKAPQRFLCCSPPESLVTESWRVARKTPFVHARIVNNAIMSCFKLLNHCTRLTQVPRRRSVLVRDSCKRLRVGGAMRFMGPQGS